MGMGIRKPCLRCNTLIESKPNVIRCESCEVIYQAQRHKKQSVTRNRDHYRGNYRSRAKVVRDNAEACWFCGEGHRPNDPFQADHVIPRDTSPDSLLLPIHRSCNVKRSAQIKMLEKEMQRKKNNQAFGGEPGAEVAGWAKNQKRIDDATAVLGRQK